MRTVVLCVLLMAVSPVSAQDSDRDRGRRPGEEPKSFRAYGYGKNHKEARRDVLESAIEFELGRYIKVEAEVRNYVRREEVYERLEGIATILDEKLVGRDPDGTETWDFLVEVTDPETFADRAFLEDTTLLREYELLSAPRILFVVDGGVEQDGVKLSNTFFVTARQRLEAPFTNRGLNVTSGTVTERSKKRLKRGFTGDAEVLKFLLGKENAEILVLATFELTPAVEGASSHSNPLLPGTETKLYGYDGSLSIEAVDLSLARPIVTRTWTYEAKASDGAFATGESGARKFTRDRLLDMAAPGDSVGPDTFLHAFFREMVERTSGAGVLTYSVIVSGIPHDRLTSLQADYLRDLDDVKRCYERAFARGVAELEIVFQGEPAKFRAALEAWRPEGAGSGGGPILEVTGGAGNAVELAYRGEDRIVHEEGRIVTFYLEGASTLMGRKLVEYLQTEGVALNPQGGKKAEGVAKWTFRTLTSSEDIAILIEEFRGLGVTLTVPTYDDGEIHVEVAE